ncbi:hypothetical protein, partial [Burkholderia ubonensis]|uniref:hypothetical protein n=1 Tax=Burkholderia ubonensis TaxID=101571 RepID=UPI001E42B91B
MASRWRLAGRRGKMLGGPAAAIGESPRTPFSGLIQSDLQNHEMPIRRSESISDGTANDRV